MIRKQLGMNSENVGNLSKKSTIMAVLFVIVVIGSCLRTYHFHDWLFFGSDQVTDAERVGAVVRGEAPWPLLGPDMSHSGAGGREARFHLGPMYYWFEIASGKLFGDYPDKYAYPDLLFSIFSIPLLFLFLRRLFRIGLAFPLLGLYSVSFYMLKFSHSAWNPNSIPFFVLLFLLSLHEFVQAGRMTRWSWVVALGLSLGVGVQLHAILLVLLPAMVFFSFLLFMRKQPFAWRKWLVIIGVALVLNAGQIRSEFDTDFANTKIFFGSVKSTPGNGSGGFPAKFRNDVNCHMQANAHMISGVGSDSCDFTIIKAIEKHSAYAIATLHNPWFDLGQLVAAAFSLAGYGLLIVSFRKEKDDRKKHLMGLIHLYCVLSFLVLLPVDVGLLRYFVHTFFVPLVFFGLIARFLMERFPGKCGTAIVVASFMILTLSNILSIRTITREYITREHPGDNTIILGEVEGMADFMIANAGGEKRLFIYTDRRRSNFIRSLVFIGEKKGFHIVKVEESKSVPAERPLFYLSRYDATVAGSAADGHRIEASRIIGNVGLYKITHEP